MDDKNYQLPFAFTGTIDSLDGERIAPSVGLSAIIAHAAPSEHEGA